MYYYPYVSISTRNAKCDFKDMIGAKFKKTGHVTLITPIME